MNTAPESTVWADPLSDGHEPAGSASAADLRHQVERTRAEMSATIDAIESRVAPRRILTRARDWLAQSANVLAARAQARTRELTIAAQAQIQRRRAEYERLRDRYPWLPAALLAGTAAAAALIALLVRFGVHAGD